MDVKITVSTKAVRDMLNDLSDMPDDMMDDGHKEMVKLTPIGKPSTWQSPAPKGYKPGNARRRTVHKVSDKIQSKYPYAARLDNGWSDQAPDGFTEPTIEHMDEFVDKYVRRIQR